MPLALLPENLVSLLLLSCFLLSAFIVKRPRLGMYELMIIVNAAKGGPMSFTSLVTIERLYTFRLGPIPLMREIPSGDQPLFLQSS